MYRDGVYENPADIEKTLIRGYILFGFSFGNARLPQVHGQIENGIIFVVVRCYGGFKSLMNESARTNRNDFRYEISIRSNVHSATTSWLITRRVRLLVPQLLNISHISSNADVHIQEVCSIALVISGKFNFTFFFVLI